MTDSGDFGELYPLGESERATLRRAVGTWAGQHRQPNRPVVLLGNLGLLTPSELATEMVVEGPVAERIERMAAAAVAERQFDALIAMLTRPPASWWQRWLIHLSAFLRGRRAGGSGPGSVRR